MLYDVDIFFEEVFFVWVNVKCKEFFVELDGDVCFFGKVKLFI